MKELKNQLKKESCYTSILTTARIRGVERVKVSNQESDTNKPQVSTYMYIYMYYIYTCTYIHVYVM